MDNEKIVIKGKIKGLVGLYIFCPIAIIALIGLIISDSLGGFALYTAIYGLLIFIALLFVPKSKLTVTKKYVISNYVFFPIDQITHLKLKRKKLEVGIGKEIFRIKLKNAKLVYVVISRLMKEAQEKAAEVPTIILPEPAPAPIAETVDEPIDEPIAEPIPETLEEKLAYNRKLYNEGKITHSEMSQRNITLLQTAFPNLY